MSVSIRPYPVIKGKDAERFLKRQRENKRKLNERVKRILETHPENNQ